MTGDEQAAELAELKAWLEGQCQLFAMCVNGATGLADCGPLGWQPACERCATHLGLTYHPYGEHVAVERDETRG